MTSSPATFVGVLNNPNLNTPSYRAAYWVSQRLFGRFLRPKAALHLFCCLLCFAPLIAYLIERPSTFVIWNYVGAFLWGSGCYIMIYAPGQIWKAFEPLTIEVDAMFQPHETVNLAVVVGSVRRTMSPVYPCIMGVVIGTAAVVTAFGYGYETDSGLVTSVFLTFFVGFLAGHSTYYIIASVGLAWKVRSLRRLSLTWAAPLLTPGLKGVSDILRRMAQLGLLLCGFLTAALITELFSGPVKLPLWLISIAVGAGLSSIVIAGVVEQRWIAVPALSAKDVTLKELANEVELARLAAWPLNSASSDGLSRLRSTMAILEDVRVSPSSYTDLALVTSYFVTVAGVALPLIVAWLAS